MLSQKDIETLTVPKNAKLDALFDVLHKLDDADEILRDAIYDYMPTKNQEVKKLGEIHSLYHECR